MTIRAHRLRVWTLSLAKFLVAIVFISSAAPSAVLPRTLPTIRPLGAPVAITVDSIGFVAGIREMSDGRVLMNDPIFRKLLLFDAGLRNPRAIADPSSIDRTPYRGIPGPQVTAMFPTATLLSYSGDSSLFIAGGGPIGLVIAPNGTVARSLQLPQTFPYYDVIGKVGTEWDGKGIVYQGHHEKSPPVVPRADSVAIKRVYVQTLRTDTLAFLRFTAGRDDVQLRNPPFADSWALMSSGTIAIIRGSDRHIEFIDPDGRTRSAAPVPFNGYTFGDANDRLWIRELSSAPAMESESTGAVYDLIDRNGRIVDRVRLPPGSWIRGFSLGFVYLSLRPPAGGTLSRPGVIRIAKFRIPANLR